MGYNGEIVRQGNEPDIVEVHGDGWVVINNVALWIKSEADGVTVEPYPNANEDKPLAPPIRVAFADAASAGGTPY